MLKLSCGCVPEGELVVGNVCFACGRPRGLVTMGWERGGPIRARSFVTTHPPKRRKPRLGDRRHKPITVIEGVAA